MKFKMEFPLRESLLAIAESYHLKLLFENPCRGDMTPGVFIEETGR